MTFIKRPVFGSEPEYRKSRTSHETLRRMTVLALRVVSDGLIGVDATECLKVLCARERLTYDAYRIESCLHRARKLLPINFRS